MPGRETVLFTVSGGTPGADSNDYTLFDSTVAFSGGLRAHDLNRLTFTVQNSQAGTLKASWSANRGTTWNQFNSVAVAIPAANTSSGPYDYLIDTFDDFKLVWTNGGVAQATWRPVGVLIRGDRASGT